MRLLFVCRMFDQVAGGVERSATTLMNAMSASGHAVHLLTWDEAGARSYYPLDPTIEWHCIDMGDPMRLASMSLRLRRMRHIRKHVGDIGPDVVIAFQQGPFMVTRISLMGTATPVIAAERNAATRFDYLRSGRYRALMFQTFRFAARLVVQMHSYRGDYPAYLAGRIDVIPNPVFASASMADTHGRPGAKTLLSVGRLSYQKNFPALIRAFGALAAEFPDWTLRIVGEGEDRRALGDIARELDIEGRVEFPGTTVDIAREYVNAQLFCLPSRWEGFPNSLAEAMAHGLPTVGYAGCSGTNELIRRGENGLLADGNGDVESLCGALRVLLGDGEMRQRLGAAATTIARDYTPERVFGLWQDLFRDVGGRQ